MDPPTPWMYNPRGWVEWPLSCLRSEFSPITPPHPLSPYFPVPLNHPRVLPWTHSLSDLPSLPEYVDPRYPSSSARGCPHGGLPGGYYSWEWHGTWYQAPHTTTPILQVTTNEPQTPGTGYKKIKIRHLSMDKLNPPPPDIGTLTYWHTRQELPQQPISPGTWWTTPVSPCTLRYQCAENRKVRYWCYTKKIAHIPHTMIPPGFGWSRHSFTLPPTTRVLLKEIVTYSFTSEWPKWKWTFPLSLSASEELVLV